MSTAQHAAQAWQESVTRSDLQALDEVRRSATRFDAMVRRRNAREYAAAVLVLLVFGTFALFPPFPLAAMRIGAIMILVGTLTLTWQLHRRASSEPLPAGLPVLVHHRAQLARQRDALASVGTWYLLPLLPGMLLVLFGPLVEQGPQVLVDFGWEQATVLAGPLLLFPAIWLINRRAAGQLQRAIDEIDLLEKDA